MLRAILSIFQGYPFSEATKPIVLDSLRRVQLISLWHFTILLAFFERELHVNIRSAVFDIHRGIESFLFTSDFPESPCALPGYIGETSSTHEFTFLKVR